MKIFYSIRWLCLAQSLPWLQNFLYKKLCWENFGCWENVRHTCIHTENGSFVLFFNWLKIERSRKKKATSKKQRKEQHRRANKLTDRPGGPIGPGGPMGPGSP